MRKHADRQLVVPSLRVAVQPALSQFGGGRAMALEAQRTDVLEIAFTAAFHYGDNMIGIPKGASVPGAQSPIQSSFQPSRAPKAFQLPFCMQAIDSATGAHAAVAFQYFFANIPWVATNAPFFHAPRRAKRHAPFGNF